MEVDEAYRLFDERFRPWEHQHKCWELIDDDSVSGMIVLSSTGSGKTEAVLIPSLIKDKRLVMIYPTRSLVNDQILRVKKYLRRYITKYPEKSKVAILDIGEEEYALQYSRFDANSISKIVNQTEYWDRTGKLKEIKVFNDRRETGELVSLGEMGQLLERHTRGIQNFELVYQVGPHTTAEIVRTNEPSEWLVRRSRKHYFGGDVILTTIDKFLYRFFGYGERKWNLIYPYRLYMGKSATEKLVVCFDEAHSYHSVSYTNFVNLVSALIGNNIRVIVMSATLPQQFLRLAETKFGMYCVNGSDHKGKKSYIILDTDGRDKKVIELIDSNLGKRIIVVRNTVSDAFNIYQKLREVSDGGDSYRGVPLLFYHGRLFSYVKSRVYDDLKGKDEVGDPYILITTHAIEAGCDLNAEILVTDYCNPDQLLQRAGRCARKKDSQGILYILGREFQSHGEGFLKDEEAYDYAHYTGLLDEHNGGELPEEMIRKETIRPTLRKDELTDALFNFLFSYVYEFDRTREGLHKSGILSTRSWIPSAKVFWVKQELDFDDLRRWAEENSMDDTILRMQERDLLFNHDPLSIGMDLLSSSEPLKVAGLKENYLVLAVEDSENKDGFVRGKINPYLHDIYILFKSKGYPNINPMDGMIQLPKIFERKQKGIKSVLTARKQLLLRSNYDRKIEFLSPV